MQCTLNLMHSNRQPTTRVNLQGSHVNCSEEQTVLPASDRGDSALTRDVGKDCGPVVHLTHAQVGHQCCERVVGHFGLGCNITADSTS